MFPSTAVMKAVGGSSWNSRKPLVEVEAETMEPVTGLRLVSNVMEVQAAATVHDCAAAGTVPVQPVAR